MILTSTKRSVFDNPDIQNIGHLEKGTGKHQSNAVFGWGGITDPNSESMREDAANYDYCDGIAYCLDSNYWKGGQLNMIESYINKHKRQLVIENWKI